MQPGDTVTDAQKLRALVLGMAACDAARAALDTLERNPADDTLLSGEDRRLGHPQDDDESTPRTPEKVLEQRRAYWEQHLESAGEIRLVAGFFRCQMFTLAEWLEQRPGRSIHVELMQTAAAYLSARVPERPEYRSTYLSLFWPAQLGGWFLQIAREALSYVDTTADEDGMAEAAALCIESLVALIDSFAPFWHLPPTEDMAAAFIEIDGAEPLQADEPIEVLLPNL